MKQKIESILDDYQYHDRVTQVDVVDAILALLPKPRIPVKDGWPDAELNCLFKCNSGVIINATVGLFDNLMERRDIVWYIPVSELLEMVEQ